MANYNVLITSVGSTTSIGIIKFIQKSKANVFVIGTDTHPKEGIAGSAFCAQFYQVPPYYENTYLPTVKSIVEQHNIQLLIPVHDKEIEVLAQNQAIFQDLNCRVVVSEPSTIQKVNNKYCFARILSEAGMLTPTTFKVEDWIQQTNHQPHERWVLKPLNGVSSRGITMGRTDEIRTKAQSVDKNEYVVQQFIEGTEYTVDVFVKRQKSYCIVPRLREEVRNGLCYKASTVDNAAFIEPVNRIVSLFDFYGPINIQFIQAHGAKTLYCIECNPRFGGTSIISLQAGVNLFDYILDDYCNKELKEHPRYHLVQMTRYWEEIFYEKQSPGF